MSGWDVPRSEMTAPSRLLAPVSALVLVVRGNGQVDCGGHPVRYGALIDLRDDKGMVVFVNEAPKQYCAMGGA